MCFIGINEMGVSRERLGLVGLDWFSSELQCPQCVWAPHTVFVGSNHNELQKAESKRIQPKMVFHTCWLCTVKTMFIINI